MTDLELTPQEYIDRLIVLLQSDIIKKFYTQDKIDTMIETLNNKSLTADDLKIQISNLDSLLKIKEIDGEMYFNNKSVQTIDASHNNPFSALITDAKAGTVYSYKLKSSEDFVGLVVCAWEQITGETGLSKNIFIANSASNTLFNDIENIEFVNDNIHIKNEYILNSTKEGDVYKISINKADFLSIKKLEVNK